MKAKLFRFVMVLSMLAASGLADFPIGWPRCC